MLALLGSMLVIVPATPAQASYPSIVGTWSITKMCNTTSTNPNRPPGGCYQDYYMSFEATGYAKYAGYYPGVWSGQSAWFEWPNAAPLPPTKFTLTNLVVQSNNLALGNFTREMGVGYSDVTTGTIELRR